jgi:hypothetical protein
MNILGVLRTGYDAAELTVKGGTNIRVALEGRTTFALQSVGGFMLVFLVALSLQSVSLA